MQAALHLERIHLPPIRQLRRVVASVVIPGMAFYFQGPRLVARIIWLAVPVLALAFLAGLGTFVAELAFALMIGAHVLSVSHLLRPLMIRHRLWVQLVFGVILFVAVSGMVYIPARNWFHNHIATVMIFRGQAFVMDPVARVEEVQRGDIVAYAISASRTHSVVVREGLGLGRVLGMPGDRVVFGDGHLTINGHMQAQLGSSKDWGGVVVPDDCWFIWPDVNILNRQFARGDFAGAFRRLALVSRSDLVARQRGWWFFRTQGST